MNTIRVLCIIMSLSLRNQEHNCKKILLKKKTKKQKLYYCMVVVDLINYQNTDLLACL